MGHFVEVADRCATKNKTQCVIVGVFTNRLLRTARKDLGPLANHLKKVMRKRNASTVFGEMFETSADKSA